MHELLLTTTQNKPFRQYLKSNLLDQKTRQRILAEHHIQTKQLAYQYHRQRSSCISVSLCQHIRKSIDYVINHALAQKPDPLESLRKESLASLYAQGFLVLEQLLSDIHVQQANLLSHPLPFANERYQSILQEQLPRFLAAYESTDKYYKACICREDFDYPLLDGLPLYHQNYHLEGVDFVHEYLYRMQLEQHFLSTFPQADIRMFILHYERQKDISVTFLGCNLCEMILTQMLLLSLFPYSATLVASQEQVQALQHMLCDAASFEACFTKVQSLLPHELATYIIKGKDDFCRICDIAMQHHSLSDLLISYQEEQITSLAITQPCDPQVFQMMMEKLADDISLEAKIALIHQTPLGFHDYLDLLHEYLFDATEYQALFASFDLTQIALLLHAAHEEIFYFHQQISLDQHFLHTLDLHEPWEAPFINYLLTLEDYKKAELEGILQSLRIAK